MSAIVTGGAVRVRTSSLYILKSQKVLPGTAQEVGSGQRLSYANYFEKHSASHKCLS